MTDVTKYDTEEQSSGIRLGAQHVLILIDELVAGLSAYVCYHSNTQWKYDI